MADEKKGITVKIDADLHAEIREYIESKGMTMAEFVSQALYNELCVIMKRVASLGLDINAFGIDCNR